MEKQGSRTLKVDGRRLGYMESQFAHPPESTP